eukprot:GHVS01107614.1.p1 GENE.GHVS01107614.1~~GHVS01107614.1.p1  ORF type:complete len:203 (+),score=41.82 GHVS01107614.1:88-696(+)
MEVGFEFVRTIVSTLSRRCTNYIVVQSTKRERFRRGVAGLGQAINASYIHLKYFGNLNWWGSTMQGQTKITLTVKPIDDDKALEFGADAMGEFIVMTIMISLVSTGLAIRRRKQMQTQRVAAERELQVEERLERLEQLLEELVRKGEEQENRRRENGLERMEEEGGGGGRDEEEEKKKAIADEEHRRSGNHMRSYIQSCIAL